MRATLDFLLHDWLAVEALSARPRFAEHSRETFAAVLDACERIAAETFARFSRLADSEEPRIVSDAGVDPRGHPRHPGGALFLPLRAAENRRLAGRGVAARRHLPRRRSRQLLTRRR